MKVLIDGFFQRIAFNTETFKFSGSGRGEYETVDGKYSIFFQEMILGLELNLILIMKLKIKTGIMLD